MTLREGILLVLATGTYYGLEIIEKLSSLRLNAHQGNLYPLLRAMEEEGLLSSRPVSDSSSLRGGRPRYYYSLTTVGEKALPPTLTIEGIRVPVDALRAVIAMRSTLQEEDVERQKIHEETVPQLVYGFEWLGNTLLLELSMGPSWLDRRDTNVPGLRVLVGGLSFRWFSHSLEEVEGQIRFTPSNPEVFLKAIWGRDIRQGVTDAQLREEAYKDQVVREQVGKHRFRGSSDRYCEICKLPDRDPIHLGVA